MPGLGLALTLASLGAEAFGSAMSAQANNQWRNKLLQRSNSLDDVFNKQYNMDYMQTPGVMNTMGAYTEGLKRINKNIEGRAVMAGSTPDAVIGEREKTNQNYGDFIRKVAAGADQYRQQKENIYNMRRDSLDNIMMAADQQKASQWDTFMKNAGALGAATIAAGASVGGSNNATASPSTTTEETG